MEVIIHRSPVIHRGVTTDLLTYVWPSVPCCQEFCLAFAPLRDPSVNAPQRHIFSKEKSFLFSFCCYATKS